MHKNKILRLLTFIIILIFSGCVSEEDLNPDLREIIAICDLLTSSNDSKVSIYSITLNDGSSTPVYKSESYALEEGIVSEFKLSGNGVKYSFLVREWGFGTPYPETRKTYSGTLNDDAFLKDQTNKINIIREASDWKILVNGKNETISTDNEPDGGTGGGTDGGNGGGTGGGTGGNDTQELMNQCVEGKQGDQKSFKLTLPANVKKMVIETSEDGGCYLNSADLFVGRSRPSIISTYPYKWNAEYSSILPNRDKENITITNPSSGEWYVMLYGFNNYFSSNLKITLSY